MIRSSSSLMKRAVSALLAVASCFALVGCETTEKALQATVNVFWTNATEKAKMETQLETKLGAGLNTALVGKKVLNLLFYDVYIHSVKSPDVVLGTKQPTIKTPSSHFWGTPGHLWYELGWKLTWAKGNGASIAFTLDLRPAFPDHRVKIYDLNVLANGTCLVDLDIHTGKTTLSVFTESASIDCRADAKGWFWTIDIKDKVKTEIKKALEDVVIGKIIAKTLSF
ncbi:MAG: hypothetical protein HZA54_10690 [Planctomycetes bacterium]|nr:hypothetical protein [Planctomycetota bacterium]